MPLLSQSMAFLLPLLPLLPLIPLMPQAIASLMPPAGAPEPPRVLLCGPIPFNKDVQARARAGAWVRVILQQGMGIQVPPGLREPPWA